METVKKRRYKENKEDKKLQLPEKPQINEETEEQEEPKKHPIIKKVFIIITLLIILFVCIGRYLEPKLLTTREYKVETNKIPDSFHGLKIVQFSDIHYGTTIDNKKLEKIVKRINNLKPDIIVFTGDLFDKNIVLSNDDKNDIINTLKELKCTLYKYSVYGNEDDNIEMYNEIMDLSDFKVLNNEGTLIYYEDNTPIEIIGLNTISSNPNYTVLTNFIEEVDTTNIYKIVLTHEPNSIDNFINYNPDLVLAGDSLGGLIKLPLFKPLFVPENSSKYYEEYYKINQTDFYISNGLGTSNLNSRFNNIPSISLYRFYKTQ